jgi:hypothetical protein
LTILKFKKNVFWDSLTHHAYFRDLRTEAVDGIGQLTDQENVYEAGE